MASAPAGEPRRVPRRAGLVGRVMRRIGHRLLRPRGGATPVGAAPVGAAVVDALPVRPPWLMISWLRHRRVRAAAARSGAPAPSGTRPAGTLPTAAETPGLVGRAVASRMTPATAGRPAAAGSPPGPLPGRGRPGFALGRPAPRPAPLLIAPGHDLPVTPVGPAAALRSAGVPAAGGSPSVALPATVDSRRGAPSRPVGTGPRTPSGPPAGPGIPVPGPGPSRAPTPVHAARVAAQGTPTVGATARAGRGAGHSAAPSARGRVRSVVGGAGSLARRPAAGPSVVAPVTAIDLPVLGGSSGPLAAPDPTGAVSVTPAPTPVISRAPSAPAARATPRERWEAAVAARPLENPRALPSSVHALVRGITGPGATPRFTAGPATRRALSAAGALGATTGSVVHLPDVPTTSPSSMSVLAHELTHARQPVRRPRFLLSGHTGHTDDDERGALAAGRAHGGALPTSTNPPGGSGSADPAAGAGLVEQLPVGRGGGQREQVEQIATTAARRTVLEAMASPAVSRSVGGAPDGGPGGSAGSTGAGSAGAGSAGAGAAGGAGGGPAGPGDGSAGDAPEAGQPSAAPGAPAGRPAQPAAPAAGQIDADKVVAMIEARLLREIERRGGRWAGVF